MTREELSQRVIEDLNETLGTMLHRLEGYIEHGTLPIDDTTDEYDEQLLVYAMSSKLLSWSAKDCVPDHNENRKKTFDYFLKKINWV